MPGRNFAQRLSEGEVVSVPTLKRHRPPRVSAHSADLCTACVPTFGPKPAVLNPSYTLETSWMTGTGGLCSPQVGVPLPVLHGQCYALQIENGAILSSFLEAK